MSDPREHQRKQAALSRVLEAVKGSSKFVVTASAVAGLVWLAPGVDLPPEAALLASSLGVEALGSILDRVAYGEDMTTEEIRKEVETVIERSISGLLTTDDFYHAFAHLLDRIRVLSQHSDEVLNTLRRIEGLLAAIPSDSGRASTLDTDRYFEWIRTQAEKSQATVLLAAREETRPGFLNSALKVADEMDLLRERKTISVSEVLWTLPQFALVGGTGSGKTSTLCQLASAVCSDRQRDTPPSVLPVYVDLAGYRGQSIPDLIHRSFRAASQAIGLELIDQLSSDGTLFVLFDDFDLAAARYSADLLRELRDWRRVYSRCRFVVATHRPQDGHRLGLPTFRLIPLNEQQIREILLDFELEDVDILAIQTGFPKEFRHLVETPLTLRMVAYAYLHSERKQVPKSRGLLFQTVIGSIIRLSEAKGLLQFDASDKIAVLGLLARWMQENETYALSPAAVSVLISQWVKEGASSVSHLKRSDLLALRSELIQSGVLKVTLNDNIQFVHASFRAYFAALTVTVDELSALLDEEQWKLSLLLWASIRNRDSTDRLVDLLSEKTAFLGSVLQERTQRRTSDQFVEIEVDHHQYVTRLRHYFLKLAQQFSIVAKNAVWENSETVRVVAASTTQNSLALLWVEEALSASEIDFVPSSRLMEIAERTADEEPFPLRLWLIPKRIISAYHPLELAYLLLLRTLFDLLHF